MVKTKKYTCYISLRDYERIRWHSQRGLFSPTFKRAANGETTFRTTSDRQLCEQLEKIVDFGATSAAEVLGIYLRGQ